MSKSTSSALTNAWRDEFPGLKACTYLNSCSLGQLSRRSRAAMDEFMDLWEQYGASAWYEIWLGKLAECRQRFAQLINARPHEVAILPSVSVALSVIGSSLDFTQRSEVVTTDMDFPTVVHQWLARRRDGARVRVLESPDRIQVPTPAFADAIGADTGLVATTHVFFTSGWIQDMAAISALAHESGALALFDGYQAAGQIPVDVKISDVDVYISGGLKWLLGGPGIVYMYVRQSLIERLEPTTTGWFAAENMFAFDPESFERSEDARRFEPGTPSVAALYAGTAGLSIVQEIGPPALRARTRELVADLVHRLRAAGFEPRMPENPDSHAGIVMVPVDDPAAVVKALAERRVIIDYRPGAIRISPYFYNTEAENERLVEALRSSLASGDRHLPGT
jgi:kynureninase